MPDIDVAEEIAKQLAIDLGAGFTHNVNVFDGKFRPPSASVPPRAFFVVPTGGPRPIRTGGKGIKVEIRTPAFNVINRGDVDNLTQATSDARLVRNKLKVMKITGLSSIAMTSSDPVPQKQDEQKSYMFINPCEATFSHGTQPA